MPALPFGLAPVCSGTLFSAGPILHDPDLQTIIYGICTKFTPFKEERCGFRRLPAFAGQTVKPDREYQGAEQVTIWLKKTVVMVGMMGAGKTAVGAALARALSVAFVDSDDEITRAADRSISEIFARDGEAFFRARESEVLGRLLRGTPCILSTGGGAFLSAPNRDLVQGTGVSVWLRADLDLLWQRVRHKTTRPLLRTANPRETLRSLYEARLPFYQMADIVVDSSADYSVEDMAQRVMDALGLRADVLERT